MTMNVPSKSEGALKAENILMEAKRLGIISYPTVIQWGEKGSVFPVNHGHLVGLVLVVAF